MGGFALGGRFTTLEGLLQNVLEKIENNPMMGGGQEGDLGGDSVTPEQRKRMEEFKTNLTEMMEGKQKFTFILDDPTGNSYLQNLYAPDPDPEMKIEHYERTYAQNDELGLNDMKVENYGEEEILKVERLYTKDESKDEEKKKLLEQEMKRRKSCKLEEGEMDKDLDSR